MTILNIIPLIGASWGILFTFFLIANKRVHANNPKAKRVLIIILFLITHNLVDAYFNYHGYENSAWSGLSYLHYHLIGYLILLYTTYLLKLEKVSRLFTYSMIAYSALRIIAIIFIFAENDTLATTMENGDFLFLDFFLALFINIVPLVRLYFKVKNIRFAVELNSKTKLEFIWLKYLIITSIIVYLAILQSSIISMFNEKEWFLFMKIESLITSFFFFGFAFLAIRFPVFSIQGDYNELPTQTPVRKYAKSTLKEDESELLWKKIQATMVTDELWKTPDFRLNDLAEKTEKTLHHVSQVINEKKQMNFFDFINHYRIKEAKNLLTSEKGKQFTILAIAFEVGFNSKTTFYNAFKKETGMTPSAYKKNASE